MSGERVYLATSNELGEIALPASVVNSSTRARPTQTLMLGAAVDYPGMVTGTYGAAYKQTFLNNYDGWTPEQELEMGFTYNSKGRAIPASAEVARFKAMYEAIGPGKLIRAANLIWQGAVLPEWITNPEVAWTEATFKTQVKLYVERVVEAVLGITTPSAWNVVNEAVAQNNTGVLSAGVVVENLGGSTAITATNPVMIFYAEIFKLVHKLAPTVRLFANGSSGWGIPGSAAETVANLKFVKVLLSLGAPIQGMGMECHVNTTTFATQSQLEGAIAEFTALGLEVEITELSIIIEGAATLAEQGTIAEAYARAALATGGKRLTTWGFSDLHNSEGESTLTTGPRAMPFNVNEALKPMGEAIFATRSPALAVAEAEPSVIRNGTVIDLCKPPYNCLPELSDCTTAINEAVTKIAEAGGGSWYFSKPGHYLISGAQKTGEYKGVPTPTTPTANTAVNGTLINLTGAKAAGYTNGKRVMFTALTAGVTNIAVNTAYYIVGEATNGFEVSLTEGGAALKVTGHELETGTTKVGLATVYNYSGQILYPAVGLTERQIAIRGAGCVAPTKPLLGSGFEATSETPSVVLISNAAAGNVFDVIPGGEANATAWSNIFAIFEDLTVRCPENPQCGGINMFAAKGFRQQGGLKIEAPSVGYSKALTGTGRGLSLPAVFNDGICQIDNTTIFGFPVLCRFAEHCLFKYLFLSFGYKALEAVGTLSTHANTFVNVDVEECVTPLYAPPGGGALIDGTLTCESYGTEHFTPGNLIEDSSNGLRGQLRVQYLTAATKGGWPQLGGLLLNVINIEPPENELIQPGGWMGSYPIDTFLRRSVVAGNIGATSATNHPWRILAGALTNTQHSTFGTITNTSAQESYAVVKYLAQGTGSRVIRAELTPATSTKANAGILVARTGTKGIFVRFREEKVQIQGETGSVVAEAAQAGGSLLMLSVVVIYPSVTVPAMQGAPSEVQVFIGETEVCKWELTKAEREALAHAGTYIEDALMFKSQDTETTVQRFEVLPLQPASLLPAEAGRSAEMVAGKITIAAPSVTATGAIIIATEGSTAIGASIVERTPGTGFKVEATATSTDRINWQVYQ